MSRRRFSVVATAAACLLGGASACARHTHRTVHASSLTAAAAATSSARTGVGHQAAIGGGFARVVPALELPTDGSWSLGLPTRGFVVSLDVAVDRGGRLAVALGAQRPSLLIIRTPSGATTVRVGPTPLRVLDGRRHASRRIAGWRVPGLGPPQADWHHVELTNSRLEIDGVPIATPASRPRAIELQVSDAAAHLRAVVVSAAANRAALLLHRVTELHARIPLGHFPVGADVSDRINYGDRDWTSGFWPGALWEAAALAGAPFDDWALQATLSHVGQEMANTHDVGFMYGESSLLAWQALCRHRARTGGAAPQLCRRLERSVLRAVAELETLAASNRAAGTIPTAAGGPVADTIIDSMMNVGILTWASAVTHRPDGARLAAQHAHRVEALLVRSDGSTTQAVDFNRTTGAVLHIGTHQGLSDTSTWSRGQGWAVYGYSATAAALHDPSLLRVALRLAGYVASHLPPDRVPRWDYDAPSAAPVDVSAGVITAAGLLRLGAACAALPGTCREGARWTALGRRMLAAALGHAATAPPLGLLDGQVLNERGVGCWCNGGELVFGLTYALEAERLAGRRRLRHARRSDDDGADTRAHGERLLNRSFVYVPPGLPT